MTRRWPSLAGAALAALVAFDVSSGASLAPILAASGLVYLGAAALRRPSAAWPLFLATFVVITLARVGLPFEPTWVLLAAAVLCAIYGVVRARRPAAGVPLQAAAMAAVGLLAALALSTGGDAAAYLVAAGLLAHAAWDVYHHRVNRIVVRSMAEFCGVLDTLLAAAIVIVAART